MPSITSLLTHQSSDTPAIQLVAVTSESFKEGLSGREAAWVNATGFTGKAGTICVLPATDGTIERIFAGVGDTMPAENDPWWLADIVSKLEPSTYTVEGVSEACLLAGAHGWCLEQYRFDRYLKDTATKPKILALPTSIDIAAAQHDIEGIALARDLINTPTDHMGPAELQDAVEELAETYGATCSTIVGDDLLEENFPAIHAVGRAAAEGRAPRLMDMVWGDENHPKITLVGKGVCFDTGGLDVKPADGMRLMKKDMGGAAHVLGLARMIMGHGLKVRLRVLIPAVENAIDGNAYRPGDVIDTRRGLTVEIGNTDAEGRVILCDAITLASEEQPDVLLDFATLTGAARVALGEDLPATFSNNETLWEQLSNGAEKTQDPLWRMPLWAPYDKTLKSDIADLCNIATGNMAGCITAALYLQRFVGENIRWAHFDVFGWAPKSEPGRPKGAAAQGLRASLDAIRQIISA